jgi:hypothetical protein
MIQESYVKSIKRQSTIIPLSLLFLGLSLGTCSIILYFLLTTHKNRNINSVNNEYVIPINNIVQLRMSELVAGVVSLSTFVSIFPNCSDLETYFGQYTDGLLKWYPGLIHLEVDPSWVTMFSAFRDGVSPIDDDSETLGVDFLLSDPVEAKLLLLQRSIVLDGPFQIKGTNGSDDRWGIYASLAVWMPDTSDWGCGLEPSNCTSECVNTTSHEKFYGIVRSLTVLDKSFFFYEGKRIDPHEYMYVLKVSNRLLFREDVTIDSSATETNENFDGLEPQEGHFDTYNLAWEIIVAPKDGWIPAVVFIPSLAGSIVLSLLISALTFVSFVKIEQHEFILNQMLPKRSIAYLALMKSGSNHAFAEEFENVTVFFSDIVGFTTIASTLKPIEIVTMLDDLYTMFDSVAHKCGVYKVCTASVFSTI